MIYIHELGHNFGSMHDRGNSGFDPVYEFSYGYGEPTGLFRTLMAYPSACPYPCSAVTHFSNPKVNYNGKPTGIDASSIDAADNAKSINLTRKVVAKFRITTTKFMALTIPNGGERYNPGNQLSIEWSSNKNSGNVKIELFNYSELVRTITSSTSDDGSYRWTIPTSIKPSGAYLIKVTSVDHSSVTDESNSFFGIGSPASASLLPSILLLRGD